MLNPIPRKKGVKVRTISVYRPCEAPGATTTYQQQLRFLGHHTAEFEPRTAIYEDLFMECTEWMDEGDQLIIGIDANEDVCTGATAEFFQTLGMREAILDKHNQLSPPATHNRNNQRQPIDGLFVTPEGWQPNTPPLGLDVPLTTVFYGPTLPTLMRSGFLVPLWLARGPVASTQRIPGLWKNMFNNYESSWCIPVLRGDCLLWNSVPPSRDGLPLCRTNMMTFKLPI